MLSNFRSFAQSPLALVIIVLLVLAFAIALPGSGGIFTGSGDAVVTVGPERISQRELSSAFNGEVRRLQDQDSSITAEQARLLVERLAVPRATYLHRNPPTRSPSHNTWTGTPPTAARPTLFASQRTRPLSPDLHKESVKNEQTDRF